MAKDNKLGTHDAMKEGTVDVDNQDFITTSFSSLLMELKCFRLLDQFLA